MKNIIRSNVLRELGLERSTSLFMKKISDFFENVNQIKIAIVILKFVRRTQIYSMCNLKGSNGLTPFRLVPNRRCTSVSSASKALIVHIFVQILCTSYCRRIMRRIFIMFGLFYNLNQTMNSAEKFQNILPCMNLILCITKTVAIKKSEQKFGNKFICLVQTTNERQREKMHSKCQC